MNEIGIFRFKDTGLVPKIQDPNIETNPEAKQMAEVIRAFMRYDQTGHQGALLLDGDQTTIITQFGPEPVTDQTVEGKALLEAIRGPLH